MTLVTSCTTHKIVHAGVALSGKRCKRGFFFFFFLIILCNSSDVQYLRFVHLLKLNWMNHVQVMRATSVLE
jgi:hypothetical protein